MPQHTPAPTPSRAVYGFALFLAFRILFIIYVIWALIPESYFKQVGIDFLPERHWAISVPIYIITVLVVFAFIIYPSLGKLMIPDIDDIKTITDQVGSQRKKNGMKLDIKNKKGECACENKKHCWKEYFDLGADIASKKRIPKLKDLDIWDVSEHLYL